MILLTSRRLHYELAGTKTARNKISFICYGNSNLPYLEMGENSRGLKCGYLLLHKLKVVCSGTFEVIPFNKMIINLFGLCCIYSGTHTTTC